jgi:hypothetical protein
MGSEESTKGLILPNLTKISATFLKKHAVNLISLID